MRFGGRRREIGQSLALLPAMVPHILISMSLLLALTFVPLPGFGALLAGHVLICLPFTIAGDHGEPRRRRSEARARLR